MSTESRIVAIENELKALKRVAPVSLGALQYPDEAPTQTYTGTVDTGGQDLVMARLSATFTRSDGANLTPLVDFAYTSSISPTYQQYMASIGIQITGNDPNVNAEFYVRGYEASTTDNSVTFFIDVLNAAAPFAGASASVTVTVQAISTVKGTLTLERLI